MALQKKFYKDSVSGLFYLDGNVIPKGNYNMFFYNSDTVVTLIDSTNNVTLLDATEITNLLKEDNSAYTNKADLLAGVSDFF